MKPKRVMIFGATFEQLALFRQAKAMGHWILGVSSRADSPCLALADQTAIVDPLDLPRCVQIAKEHRIEAVASDQCDYSQTAAAFVAQLLNLPGVPLESTLITGNKRKVRERCREAGIPQPQSIPCSTLQEARAAAKAIGFPVIVKPVDNRGSIGVCRVESLPELESAFFASLGHSPSRETLVEEFVEGCVLTVDGFCFGPGKHRSLAVASREVYPGAHPVAREIVYPAEIPEEARKRAFEINDRVVAACGLQTGATHAEYIYSRDGRIVLVEIANRGGGIATSSVIVPALTGFDPTAALVQIACGESVRFAPKKPVTTSVVLRFFEFEPGSVKAIENAESAAQGAGVLEFGLWIRPGQKIGAIHSGPTRHGFVIASGNDAKDAKNNARAAENAVRIRYAEEAKVGA